MKADVEPSATSILNTFELQRPLLAPSPTRWPFPAKGWALPSHRWPFSQGFPSCCEPPKAWTRLKKPSSWHLELSPQLLGPHPPTSTLGHGSSESFCWAQWSHGEAVERKRSNAKVMEVGECQTKKKREFPKLIHVDISFVALKSHSCLLFWNNDLWKVKGALNWVWGLSQ